MTAIDIHEVITRMDNIDSDIIFSIGFVRAGDGQGGPKGSIKMVAHCRKGHKVRSGTPRIKHTALTISGKKRPLHKHNGTLPLVDTKTDQQITVRTSHIISFNNFKVKH